MASTLVLIRHGITEGNQKNWFYGHTDMPLAEQGHHGLARLKQSGIYPEVADDAKYYTTGLVRTEETLRAIFGDKEYETREAFKEMNFGDYECNHYDDLKHIEQFTQWIYDETGDVEIPGGETRNQFASRVSQGLKALIAEHALRGKDATTVLVCHGGVISAIMQELFPEGAMTMWDWIPKPGLGYVVELDGETAIGYEKISDIKKLGFGFMRLPMIGEDVDIEQTKEMVDLFLSKGFTYFDTAWGYLEGKSEEAVKTALVDRHPRDSFYLATKLPAWCASTEEEAKAMFETSLKRTGVDNFDYFLLHNLGPKRTASFDEFHIWDFLAEKKAMGKIRYLGFSMHDKATELEKVLQAHPEVDFVQLQINYADWEAPMVEAKACYEVARKYNKEIIIMEPLKGGSLSVLPESVERIFKNANPDVSISAWGLRFAASLDGVITVLSGMSNMEQMEDNLKTMEAFQPLNEEEMKVVAQVRDTLKNMPNVPCTACGYCEKGCPESIAIPGIFRASNNLTVFGNVEGAKGNYQWETRNGGVATKCIGCGQCEKVCPQQIKIIDELAKAAELFA